MALIDTREAAALSGLAALHALPGASSARGSIAERMLREPAVATAGEPAARPRVVPAAPAPVPPRAAVSSRAAVAAPPAAASTPTASPVRLTASRPACERANTVADATGLPDDSTDQVLRRLVAQERPALLARARRFCRNEADAQDLVQSTAVRVLERASRFRNGEHARSWLYTVLANLFIDRCRKEARAPQRDELDAEQLAAPVDEGRGEPAWASVTPDDLRAALQRLDEPSRQVFELRELDRRSYEEIAEVLGIPKNTVGTRLFRTRLKLKALLLPGSPGAEDDADARDGGTR